MSENTSRLSTALADRYRIERRLGEGGMATVYLAEDLKHKRKVALKVLKPELAAVLGGERFVQEITTTASLQHPHILPLFDSGTADGFLFYVMPFIDGETLRDKLDRETQLGVDEAVKIASEIADALDYAHRNGIIHRDIKPENILLHDGRPMVADFGIALAVSAAAGGRMTETGLSLGTPHYMSPEQATAEKEITNRSDIYSVGSVLYEMLTGSPPHVGATAQQIIMKIVTEEASPITKARKSVPSNIVAAVARSLEKLPADRFSTAKEFAEALANPAFTHGAGGGAPGGPVLPSSRRPVIPFLALATIFALALAAWGWLRPEPTPPVNRYGLDLSPGPVATPCCQVPTPAPDGSYLVYHGPIPQTRSGQQLWIKRRDSQAATPVSGTVGARSYAISPDGEWIAFVVNRTLRKVQIVGGVPLTLVDEGVAADFGIAWMEDDTIVYVQTGRSLAYFQLGQVAATGGEPETVFSSDTLLVFAPASLPGGRAVLFLACNPRAGCELRALNLTDGTSHRVLPNWQGGTAQYVATGHVVYVQNFRLLAVPFDLDRLEVTGSPVALADSIATGLEPVRVSRSGTMVVAMGGAVGTTTRYELVWVDRGGTVTAVDDGFVFQSTGTAGNHGWALSPDGTRLAIGLATESGDDIWIKELASGTLSRLTTDPGSDFRPRWTADGRFVTFGSFRNVPGVYRRRADGTGTDSLLFAGSVDEGMLTPDGTWVLLREGPAGVGPGGRDISGFRPGIDSAAVPVLATEFDEEAITPSPDGRWLAYQSDETGQTEVFVRPFPDVDSGKWQISNGGGQAPLWSRDGRELFYLGGGENMMAVTVTTRGGFAVSQPQTLFRVPEELLVVQSDYYTPWDVAPDGRFIMARLGDATAEDGMIVVAENWFQELRERMEQ